MSIVAGVDFGTLSVRVSLVDSARGRVGSGTAEYPRHRTKDDPGHASQSHADHMHALAEAMRKPLADAGVPGSAVEAIAIDTTGSSVIPVDEKLQPLDDYYLRCDHRAPGEAAPNTGEAPAARRLLPLGRPSRRGGSGADHRDGAPQRSRRDPVVRGHLFL